MHQSSLDKMREFRDEFLKGREHEQLRIADLGSQDINGSFRPIFYSPRWEYVGIDMEPGRNVDVVLTNPYHWKEIGAGSVDIAVSGQAFEHVEWFWLTMLQIERVLKPAGLCCVIAPSGGYEHRYPVDCWRFYPDGFRALARYAGLEVLDAYAQWEPKGYADGSDDWRDCVLIARKVCRPLPTRIKAALRRHLIEFASRIR